MAIRWGIVGLSAALVAAGTAAFAQGAHDDLIAKHASSHNVPEALVRRVIAIESRGNATAVSKGNYGLMQIRLGTARALGYDGGPDGLLDADTNLKYAVKYLAGAYRAAGCDPDRAVALYQRGYHGIRSKCTTATEIASAAAKTKAADKTERGFTLAQAQVKSWDPAPAGADVLKPKVVHTVAVPRLPGPSSGTGPQAAPAKALPLDKPEPIAAVPARNPVEAPAVAAAPEAESVAPKSTRKSDALVSRAALKPVEAPKPVQVEAPQAATTVAPVVASPVLEQPKPVERPVVAAVTTGIASGSERKASAPTEAPAAKPLAAKKDKKPAREAAPKRPPKEASPKKEDDIPSKVAAFFKKLVTPDPKPEQKPARRQRDQANLQAVR